MSINMIYCQAAHSKAAKAAEQSRVEIREKVRRETATDQGFIP